MNSMWGSTFGKSPLFWKENSRVLICVSSRSKVYKSVRNVYRGRTQIFLFFLSFSSLPQADIRKSQLACGEGKSQSLSPISTDPSAAINQNKPD